MHTTLSVKALVIMGKVESTSDFQATSASLDGASNTLYGKKIRFHMQKHFCRYQHQASQLLCNKNLAYNGGTSNLTLHLERKSIQYQGHGQGQSIQSSLLSLYPLRHSREKLFQALSCFFVHASDRKLGGAWEQAVVLCHRTI